MTHAIWREFYILYTILTTYVSDITALEYQYRGVKNSHLQLLVDELQQPSFNMDTFATSTAGCDLDL